MLVSEFKEKEGYRYSERLLNCLPEVCLDERCGAPTEMTEVLTSLKCSNPRCPTKIARRLVAITSMLGIKDLGVSRANDFVSKHGIDNPLLIFAYEPDSDGELGYSVSLDVSKRISEQFLQKKAFTLWEFVRVANLPFIQSSALAIFGDYDDLEQAYSDIEAGGVEFIRNKLNINKGASKTALKGVDVDESELEPTDISVRALRVYNSLIMFKEDLFQALPFVEIIKVHQEGMKTIKAVCSEEVGSPFRTKAEFYATINNLFKNIHVEFLNSVTKGIDYLIWAGAEGNTSVRVTNKVNKVRKYNETFKQHEKDGKVKEGEHYIPIMTAASFMSMLEGWASEA